jgi:hypothetical protein
VKVIPPSSPSVFGRASDPTGAATFSQRDSWKRYHSLQWNSIRGQWARSLTTVKLPISFETV